MAYREQLKHYEQRMILETRFDIQEQEFVQQGTFIEGITQQDVSEYITRFPFIYDLYKKNSPENKSNLIKGLMKVPTSSDGIGFIYGFISEVENKVLDVPFWIKMGRTRQQPPQKRIFQWEKEQDLELTEMFTVHSLYNIKLEYLVHQLFAYARKPRVLNGKKRKEWFYFQQITLTAAAVNILNHIMNSIHSSAVLKLKPSFYSNRELRQLNDKISSSNLEVEEIIKFLEPAETISRNICRDLGIQMRSDEAKKEALANATTSQQFSEILGPYVVGKQLLEMIKTVSEAEQKAQKLVDSLAALKVHINKDIKLIHENTKVKFVKPTPARPNKPKRQKKTESHISEQSTKVNEDSPAKQPVVKTTVFKAEQEETKFEAKEEYDLGNTGTNKYRRTQRVQRNIQAAGSKPQTEKKQTKGKVAPEPRRQNGKMTELKCQNMAAVSEYMRENPEQQIMIIAPEFSMDTSSIVLNNQLIIIADTIVVRCPVAISKGEGRSKLRMVCKSIQNSKYIEVEPKDEKNVLIYITPQRESILPIDPYHIRHPEPDPVITMLAKQVHTHFIDLS